MKALDSYPWFVFLVILELSSAAAIAGDCNFQKYQDYSQAKALWQNELTDLVKGHHPDLEDVADEYLGVQLLLIEKNLVAVELLLVTSPQSLALDGSLNQWLQLSSEDQLKLASESEEFARLLEVEKEAKTRSSHPNGDQLRQVMRSEVMQRPEFANLLEDLNSRIAEIESRSCEE